MRGFRSDAVSVATVVAAVGAVAAILPFGTVRLRSVAARGERSAFAAFVSLDHKEEVAALKAAKNSWNADAGGVRRMRAELFFGELPAHAHEPAFRFGDRPPAPPPPLVEPALAPYMPSRAAKPPAAVAPGDAGDNGEAQPAFSREELLKMN